MLTAARLAARGLDAAAGTFIEYGMPETVVADFNRLLERYEEAIRRQEVGKSERASARASLETTFTAAMAAVHRLDVIVANTLADDRAAMAAWARGRRVSYARRVTTNVNDPVASSSTDRPADLDSDSMAPRRLLGSSRHHGRHDGPATGGWKGGQKRAGGFRAAKPAVFAADNHALRDSSRGEGALLGDFERGVDAFTERYGIRPESRE